MEGSDFMSIDVKAKIEELAAVGLGDKLGGLKQLF